MRGGVIRYAAKKNGPIRRNAAESGAREEKRLIGPGPTDSSSSWVSIIMSHFKLKFKSMGKHFVWDILLQSQACTSNLGAEVRELKLKLLLIIHPLPPRTLEELRLHAD